MTVGEMQLYLFLAGTIILWYALKLKQKRNILSKLGKIDTVHVNLFDSRYFEEDTYHYRLLESENKLILNTADEDMEFSLQSEVIRDYYDRVLRDNSQNVIWLDRWFLYTATKRMYRSTLHKKIPVNFEITLSVKLTDYKYVSANEYFDPDNVDVDRVPVPIVSVDGTVDAITTELSDEVWIPCGDRANREEVIDEYFRNQKSIILRSNMEHLNVSLEYLEATDLGYGKCIRENIDKDELYRTIYGIGASDHRLVKLIKLIDNGDLDDISGVQLANMLIVSNTSDGENAIWHDHYRLVISNPEAYMGIKNPKHVVLATSKLTKPT